MRGVNNRILLGMGIFLMYSSSVHAMDYEKELELRTLSKIEAEKDNYGLGASDEEIKMMATIAEAEAGNQGIQGKRYVIDVILNRVDSDIFPNSIEKVIFQSHQFSCVDDGAYEVAASNISNESYEAVYDELVSRDNSEIVFFTAYEYGQYGVPSFAFKDHFFSICRD